VEPNPNPNWRLTLSAGGEEGALLKVKYDEHSKGDAGCGYTIREGRGHLSQTSTTDSTNMDGANVDGVECLPIPVVSKYSNPPIESMGIFFHCRFPGRRMT